MRTKRATIRTLVSLSAGALLVACFDLLHSTQDVLTACELDAQQPGCAPALNGGEAVETDFCTWTPTEARQHAVHACAWLGACETPMGDNAFGPCVFQALLAYDCSSNPNHRVQHGTHDRWDCLQRARDCADVDACVFQQAVVPGCEDAGEYWVCREGVRIRCADGGVKPYAKAHAENCALWGKTCAARSGRTVCAGDPAGIDCDANGCGVGTTLQSCVASGDGGPSLDWGIDCGGNGAGYCAAFPSPDAARWVACKASADAAVSQNDCEPDTAATCDRGRATSCPSGTLETIDCATLLGSDGSTSACSGGPLTLGFDWTSPCTLATPDCTSDSCNAGTVTSCERGAAFSVDCETEGLNACQMQTAEPGSVPRAACTPP
jgi:hypothetical protein